MNTRAKHIYQLFSIFKLSLKVTLAKVDTMAAAIELKSLENIINDSEIVPNSSSCNLVFNLVKTGKDTLIPRL